MLEDGPLRLILSKFLGVRNGWTNIIGVVVLGTKAVVNDKKYEPQIMTRNIIFRLIAWIVIVIYFPFN